MKLFKCANIDEINDCQQFFKVELPSEMLEKKSNKLDRKFVDRKNLCRYFDILCINLAYRCSFSSRLLVKLFLS